MSNTFRKPERLNKKKIIEKMFQGGVSRSFTVFPMRVVYLLDDDQLVPLSMMVSVSKHRFKHAVKRNRVKRQIREAWRLQKQPLSEVLLGQQKHLAVAFIYLSEELQPTALIIRQMELAICKLCEIFQPNDNHEANS